MIGNCLSPTTTTSYVSENLVTLFERSASNFPSAIAIEKGPLLLDYAQLNNLASQVGCYLKSIIIPRAVICVHADRSINWIIAIYGILKANAVYCPIDSTLPADLRKSYFDSAESNLFLTSEKKQTALFSNLNRRVVSVEEIIQDTDLLLEKPLKSPEGPLGEAYICFTSGSTGKPKGVICTHQGLVSFQRDLEARLFISGKKNCSAYVTRIRQEHPRNLLRFKLRGNFSPW